MMLDFLFPIGMLMIGLILLAWSGDRFVEDADALAEQLGVSPLIVGLTVVAFGTSAPELVVAINAVIAGETLLATGSIIGSNIANVFLVLAATAILVPLNFEEKGLSKNLFAMLAATFGFCLFALDGRIGLIEAIILTGSLIAYLVWNVVTDQSCEQAGKSDFAWSNGAFLLLSIGGLLVGADLTVEGGIKLAGLLGVEVAIIGLTAVAIGTSLPELVACLSAAIKGRTEISIGAIVGSNVFNLLAVGGISGVVAAGQGLNASGMNSSLILMGLSALVLVAYTLTKATMRLSSGLILLSAYAAYVVWSLAKSNFLG